MIISHIKKDDNNHWEFQSNEEHQAGVAELARSHPAWVRGLILLTSTELDCGLEVAPCMVHGLKQLRSLPFR